MAYKSAVVVLIGAQTAGRRWVKYEIEKAWNDKRKLVGVHIHGLAGTNGRTDSKGANPFVQIDIPEVSIGVLEACRGRGIGTRLLETLVDCAGFHRVPALSLSVEVDNPAVRLYTRLGWRVFARSGGSLTMLLRVGAESTHPTATF